MNQKETYENIIARKLEQLPVPAMEDAIWNRISAQLDIEMPETPQAPETTVPPAANTTFLNIVTLFVFLIAITTFIFVEQRRTAILPVVPPPVQLKDSILQPPPEVLPPPPARELIPPRNIPAADTVQTVTPLLVTPVITDTLSTITPDLIEPPPAVITPVITPVADTPRPKPKGVKGLRDEDYKIAPKPN
ncbi:hypothetical protein [Chitinophaga rhizophila]|uniref:Energy transducer TonB n=1 Tax=Chitinophaga rhizophila TaxID=2866212 RepID=A0ABS7GCT2_9BACT|nr:hypothetical protein [Chitinophaga rhizophila]MBW8684965.1 hypothetical protein [Chitinophaga rhizophila]